MPYSPTEYWSRLYERGDLSAAGQSGLPVSCCSLHVTEDDAFQRAGRSVAALVAPGGYLVLALDRLALASGAAPSTKIALFRRPG